MRPNGRNEPPVTIIDGRGFRNESLELSGRGGLTPDDRRRMLDAYHRSAEDRLAQRDHSIAAAIRLGAALKQLKGET